MAEEKTCMISMWLKKFCLCPGEEPLQCWHNKQPLRVSKTGFALHVFKVESPEGIPANAHPPRLEKQVNPIPVMMVGPRLTAEAPRPAFYSFISILPSLISS